MGESPQNVVTADQLDFSKALMGSSQHQGSKLLAETCYCLCFGSQANHHYVEPSQVVHEENPWDNPTLRPGDLPMFQA